MSTDILILAQSQQPALGAELASSVVAIDVQNAAPPEWVQIFPASSGQLATQDGRRFQLTNAAAVIEASMAGGRDLAIDFDHATDLAATEGRPAPAGGWIKELQAREDGVWARVAWNERGRAALAGLEYRYLSPVFTLDKKSGAVTRVLRASLTNNPAFEMKALAHANHQENTVNKEQFKELARKLGLDPETATVETVLAAAEAATAAVQLPQLASALGVQPESLTAETAITAIAALKAQRAEQPDPSKFVPMGAFEATRAELASLKASLGKERAEAAVDEAISSGRVTPALRDWAIEYASKDLEGFRAFAGKQPQIVGGRIAPTGGDGAPTLTESDRQICAALGVSEENFLAQRKREQEAVL